MARASVQTMLPLDRWAYHVGVDPRHFNQVTSALAPTRSCHNPWLQYGWQGADRVGREDLAQAIAQAEADLTALLGYYPLPQWVSEEVHRVGLHHDPTLFYRAPQNPRQLFQSVQTHYGQVISGGLEAVAEIDDETPLVWEDNDADGYFETAHLTHATTVTDVNEIRCYFPGHDPAPEWEIRPLRQVTISGGVVDILIDRHLLVDPDLWEALNPADVDGDDDANFLTDVAIYRVYNDPSQQCQLQWEREANVCSCGSVSCAACAWTVQWACLQTRDPRHGFVTYQPGTWDAVDEAFDVAELTLSRAPERVRLWYHAGYESPKVARPWAQMDPDLERLIVMHSCTLLDRPVCACGNVEGLINRWREDRALMGETDNYRMTERDLLCPWGTREGSLAAYRRALLLGGDRAPLQRAVEV